jgi:hypothetical protein
MINIAIAAFMAAAKPSSIELTVYNQGFGLVKEVRSIDLKLGRQTLAVEDVAAMIDPTSVGFRSLTDKGSFDVLEQNYRYDLINPEAILNKSVGQRLRFIRTIANVKDVLYGVLLSAPTAVVASPNGGSEQTFNGMVIRTDDGRIVLNPTGEVEVQHVPEGLISRPTLLWDLNAQRSGPNSVELSYITQGMKWEANYVLTLGDGALADLQGWVTLDNQSGATYENAKLKLLAGEVNLVAPQPPAYGLNYSQGLAVPDAPPPKFIGQSLFEYHLYTLQRPATVKNKETKQISLLEAKNIPFVKKLIFDWTSNPYYVSEARPGFYSERAGFQINLDQTANTSDKYAAVGQFDFGGSGPASRAGQVGTTIHPKVKIVFTNDQKSHLGMPLPKGKFRVYQRDNEGSVQMLGEGEIDHTPRNETVGLVIGQAFDVVGTRKTSNVRIVRNHIANDWYEIELRNRKETAQKVYVIEHPDGDWRILKENVPSTKLDANTLQFELTLKPNEVKTISYTIEIKE